MEIINKIFAFLKQSSIISTQNLLTILLIGVVFTFYPDDLANKYGLLELKKDWSGKIGFILIVSSCILLVRFVAYSYKNIKIKYITWQDRKRKNQEKTDQIKKLKDHIKSIFSHLSHKQKKILLKFDDKKKVKLHIQNEDVYFFEKKEIILITDKISSIEGLYLLNSALKETINKCFYEERLEKIIFCLSRIEDNEKKFLELFLEVKPSDQKFEHPFLNRKIYSAVNTLISHYILVENKKKRGSQVTLSKEAFPIVEKTLGQKIKRDKIVLDDSNIEGLQGGSGAISQNSMQLNQIAKTLSVIADEK